jgi:hypothetical protein
MLKITLWLGTPAVVTFLVSPHSVRLENTLLIFALTLVALFVGIGPRLSKR